MDLIFSKSSYRPSEVVAGHVGQPGTLEIFSLSTLVVAQEIVDSFELSLPAGAYGVRFLSSNGVEVFSAIEVIENPWQRLRYGFVSEFDENVDVDSYVSWAKKAHLTSIQFYDWAWKHELLMSPDETYGDPLGRTVSLSKVTELINGYEKAGIAPSGYVAVYAVDSDGWKRWQSSGTFTIDGKPFQLGEDFLWILDPADEFWLPHLIEQLKLAHSFGFNTFHLDQYGWPKIAKRLDGSTVDLAVQFPIMLQAIVAEIPTAKFIFNNVNDFPTWSTSKTPQHATYIEVWDPNSTYNDLTRLVDRSRILAPEKPVILSAYLKPFSDIDNEDRRAKAEASLELAFAAISSGGASHLITGGNSQILHDPYYVRNHHGAESTTLILEKLHNFLVASGDLIFDQSRVDITLTSAFGINNEVQFTSADPISESAKEGALWIRVYRGDNGLTIHVINLLDQSDSIWDSPKNPIQRQSTIKFSIDAAGYQSKAFLGTMSQSPVFAEVGVTCVGSRIEGVIPINGSWVVLNIPLA
jgi:dextranase